MEVQEKWVFINWLKMQEIQWAYVNNFWREGSISQEKTEVLVAYFDQTNQMKKQS